jgi:hypothetical protein
MITDSFSKSRQDFIDITFDGFVKSPDAALRCILRHCGVPMVRLIPQDLRALPANFLRSHHLSP